MLILLNNLLHNDTRKTLKLKPEKLLEELKAIAETIGVQVIIDKGNFSGGHCLVYDERKIVLNKLLPPEVKAAKLAQSLTFYSLEGVELKPALRDFLNNERLRLASRTKDALSDEAQAVVNDVLASA
jgi:hypothetical protein